MAARTSAVMRRRDMTVSSWGVRRGMATAEDVPVQHGPAAAGVIALRFVAVPGSAGQRRDALRAARRTPPPASSRVARAPPPGPPTATPDRRRRAARPPRGTRRSASSARGNGAMTPAVSIVAHGAVRDAARQAAAHRPGQHRVGVGRRGDRAAVRLGAPPTRACGGTRFPPAPRSTERERGGARRAGPRSRRPRSPALARRRRPAARARYPDERLLGGAQERDAVAGRLGAAGDDRIHARLVEGAASATVVAVAMSGCRSHAPRSISSATGRRTRRSRPLARHPAPRRLGVESGEECRRAGSARCTPSSSYSGASASRYGARSTSPGDASSPVGSHRLTANGRLVGGSQLVIVSWMRSAE